MAAVLTQHLPEERRAAAAARPGDSILGGAEIEDAEHLGLVDSALDLAARGVVGEVHQRARDACAGNAVHSGYVGLGVSVALR